MKLENVKPSPHNSWILQSLSWVSDGGKADCCRVQGAAGHMSTPHTSHASHTSAAEQESSQLNRLKPDICQMTLLD